MYNRASADPDGKPWSERKKYVWWDAEQVKTHVGRIFDKLGVRDRPAAIVYAFDHRGVQAQS